MYATRLFSMYIKDPSFLSTPPPEFLYLGYLEVTDEESEAEDVWFWGLLKATRIENLLFPQNKAWTCSTEEAMGTYYFCTNDVKPTDFDHRNIYQQVEMSKRRGGDFIVKSVVTDRFPPDFLRHRGSSVNS
ncbi:hypothetical protein GIB67_017090 [Kingdonia uniflora]|uniref:Uncharacterized protein n=1 Tax=Kingdonia uniflora TaxID=39325 RepID=A0A7J7NCL0_9MAGN|nr:hypothetical protein GIB67_017090 [Kingdonia uniflora]